MNSWLVLIVFKRSALEKIAQIGLHRLTGVRARGNIYSGVEICKIPDDLMLYHNLFYYAKPATVIELGSFIGGFALFIMDTLKLLNNPASVYSIDIDHSQLSKKVKQLQPDKLTFLQGDCNLIEKTLTPDFLSSLPHPWVVIEDAHVNMIGVLKYLHQYLEKHDYIVVEDTSPILAKEVGMGGISNSEYELMGPKQLNALKEFLCEYEEYYSVDSFFPDLFGYNGTWHWHGFIKKMKNNKWIQSLSFVYEIISKIL